jgi:hypothetical protein
MILGPHGYRRRLATGQDYVGNQPGLLDGSMLAAMIAPVQLMCGRASTALGDEPIFTGTMVEATLLGEVCSPQSCLRSGVIVCARVFGVN